MKLILIGLLTLGACAASFDEIVLPAGPHPGVMAATDVNHDSRPDLIVTNLEEATVTILLNDALAVFIRHRVRHSRVALCPTISPSPISTMMASPILLS